MSEFNKSTVRKVADLARVELTDAEAEKYAAQLSQVLDYMQKLNAVKTDGIEPLTHALDLVTPLRPDERKPGPGAETMVSSAPAQLHENFKVPQVMGGEG